MDNILGRLYYIITGNTDELNVSINRSRKELSKLGSQMAVLGRQIRTFSAGIMSAALIKAFTEASSRADELQNKFDTVFGDMAASTESWAETYADATSRGRIETMEFLALQQDIRTGFGDTVEGAAAFSKAVVGIANDLASFSNIPVTEAIAAINSGLNGEFEALRRLGVGLNVAIINQMDYAESIGKTWDEMDNLERQEAILSGIVSQSANALHQSITSWEEYDYTLGDAAITSQSFANQMQGFMGTLTDFKAEIGDELIPIASALLGGIADLMHGFNDLDDSIQTMIVSAAAAGAAWLAIGGPIGIAAGAAAGLAIGLSNIRSSEEKLEDTTSALADTTDEYRNLLNQLSSDTGNLSAEERALLEVRADLARTKATVAMSDLVEEWKTSSEDIKEAIENEAEARSVLDAFMILQKDGIDGVNEKLDELKEKGRENLTEYERNTQSWLQSMSEMPGKYIPFLESYLEEYYGKVQEAHGNVASLSVDIQSAIFAMADAYRAGILDLSIYEINYADLCETIKNTAAAMDAAVDRAKAAEDSTAAAASATREWRNALREQNAELLESAGLYEEAGSIRMEILREEQEAAVRQLALDSDLIESGENAADITIDELRRKLSASEETNAELIALDQYFANEEKRINDDIQKALDEAADRRRQNAEEVSSLLRSQAESADEEAAAQLEAAGRFEEALEIRRRLINEERDEAIAAMQAKVDAGEATEAEIAGLVEYYSNEIAKAEAESAEKEAEYLAEREKRLSDEARIRTENAAAVESMLDRQRRAEDEAAASELETAGRFKEALEIRKRLIEEERDAAVKAMEDKVAANEATQAELDRINEYYDNEIAKAEEESARRLQKMLSDEAEMRRRNAEETKDLLLRQRRESDEISIRDLEGSGEFEKALEIRKRLINEERNLEVAAMAESVARNEATQEDINRLNQYYDNEILAAEKETADKIAEYQESLTGRISNTYQERLRAQQEASRLAAASELESLGDFQGALDIREGLIEEEREAAIKALDEKGLAAEEYEKELAALNEYYDAEIVREAGSTAQAEIDAQKEKAEEIKDINRQLFNSILSFAGDFSSAIGDIYSAMSERRMQQIDDETEAALAALGLQEDTKIEKLQKEYSEAVKNGDMELAQEKEREIQRAQIEEEADERKKKLQREEAERSKQLAIFQATIDTLASVIGFMSDPGGWAGIAMSAMAAATGAAQIAAIMAEPLPSYAVGATEIDRDQIAQLHQGELVVPKTFAEGIRDGDISIGGSSSNVEVTIINASGAKASVDRIDDDTTTKLRITIGDAVASEISKGRFDTALTQRYQITRRNQRG